MKSEVTSLDRVFVLLGASNLARGHYALSQCLIKSLYPNRVGFLFALGPGRGYHARGGVLLHSYSPIEKTKILSRAYEFSKNGVRIAALVTDIGNDILYGISWEELAKCLESIFQSLQEMNATIIVNPISSFLENELSYVRFLFLRTIFYPKSRITYEQTRTAISKINKYLKNRSNISLIKGLDSFVGWDNIHYGILKGHSAWNRIAAEILNNIHEKQNVPIRAWAMIASYKIHFRHMVINDLLSLGKRGVSYF